MRGVTICDRGGAAAAAGEQNTILRLDYEWYCQKFQNSNITPKPHQNKITKTIKSYVRWPQMKSGEN